jgi:hypothetical protein
VDLRDLIRRLWGTDKCGRCGKRIHGWDSTAQYYQGLHVPRGCLYDNTFGEDRTY